MALKGQNLRILLGGKVIAGAKSCTIKVSAQTETASTKDSPDDWEEFESVAKSWEISAEALVVADTIIGTRKWSGAAADKATVAGTVRYLLGTRSTASFALYPGDAITLESTAVTSLDIIGNSLSSVLATSTTGIVRYKNTSTSGICVHAACSGTNHTGYVDIRVKDANDVEDMYALINAGTEVTVNFSLMSGNTHRTEDTVIRTGQAIIRSLTVRADDRADAVYTATLEGVGEFAEPE